MFNGACCRPLAATARCRSSQPHRMAVAVGAQGSGRGGESPSAANRGTDGGRRAREESDAAAAADQGSGRIRTGRGSGFGGAPATTGARAAAGGSWKEEVPRRSADPSPRTEIYDAPRIPGGGGQQQSAVARARAAAAPLLGASSRNRRSPRMRCPSGSTLPRVADARKPPRNESFAAVSSPGASGDGSVQRGIRRSMNRLNARSAPRTLTETRAPGGSGRSCASR